MDKNDFEILIDELSALPVNSEIIKFKVDNSNSQYIGECISALSNSANIENKGYASYVKPS